MANHGRNDEEFKARKRRRKATSKSYAERLKQRAANREAKRVQAEADAAKVAS